MNKGSKTLIFVIGAFLLSTVLPVEAQQFVNPLGDTVSVTGLLRRIVGFLLGISGFLAMAALVWGGILYIVSLGNDQRVGMAKQIIMWAIIGMGVIFLSYFVIFSIWDFLINPTT